MTGAMPANAARLFNRKQKKDKNGAGKKLLVQLDARLDVSSSNERQGSAKTRRRGCSWAPAVEHTDSIARSNPVRVNKKTEGKTEHNKASRS